MSRRWRCELEVRRKATSISAQSELRYAQGSSAAHRRGVQRMLSSRDSMCRIPRCFVPIAALLLAAACTPSSDPATGGAPQGEVRASRAAGLRPASGEPSSSRPGHEAAVFDLNGSVVLSGEHRPAVGFRARVIGFSDDRATMLGRSVWTDERGDQVFSDLRGDTEVTGNRIFGTIRGGTGRLRRGDRRIQLRVEIHGRIRGRRRERAGGRPQRARSRSAPLRRPDRRDP